MTPDTVILVLILFAQVLILIQGAFTMPLPQYLTDAVSRNTQASDDNRAACADAAARIRSETVTPADLEALAARLNENTTRIDAGANELRSALNGG